MSFSLGPYNPLDPSDGGSDGDAFLFPSQGFVSNTDPSPTPVVVPAEAVEAQAAVSNSGSGGMGSVVAETSGGLTVNLLFDAAAMAAPASFRSGIEQAAAILSSAITDKVTVNINIDYSGTGGGAAAGPDNGLYESYSTIRSDLINNATPGDTSFNALPTGSTIQGQSEVAVWNAQLKLFGLISPNDTTTDDGSATFATDINPSLLVGVALHELTHAMGRVPYGPEPDIFDLYRFTSPGVRLFTDNIPATAAYFSLDGGNTKIADYGQNSDPSDFLNSGVQGPNDPFNEYYSGSTLQHLTATDLKQLDALGFHLASNTLSKPVILQTDGTTELVQSGINYYFDTVGSSTTGPELKHGGSAVYAGEFGGWTPIGAIQTASGYDLALENPGTHQYSIWSTDADGNYVSNLTPALSGSSTTIEDYETLFNQDLNGDGTIGIPQVLIHNDGTTKFVEDGNNYFLDPASGGTGPELRLNGAPVVAGQVGTWTPIGAVQVAGGGYDIGWHNLSSGLYTVWSTDANGNYLSNLIGAVPGNSTALESFETTFNQDLNGDGAIGIPQLLIHNDGATKFVEVGNNYFLDPASGGTGPELRLNGAPVVAGQVGTWTPIGAVQVASGGYDIAWHDLSSGLYTVWSTDANGNYLSNLIGAVPGNSTALESFETTFNQDLNGDGAIGIPQLLIHNDGTTKFVEVGNNYFLDPASGGTGPELRLNGAPVVAGQVGTWTPIGAVQVASGGYDIAWHDLSSGLYTVWSTDANGNYLSNLIGAVPGNSTALESFEATFNQDLNGDAHIGIPPATSPAGTQSPAAQADQITFDSHVLTLQTPSTFSGEIVGFAGDGTLAGSDQIDLHGLNYNTIHSSFDGASGTLPVSDGSTTASLQLLGHYAQDNFHFADDGNGGTLVLAATTAVQGGADAASTFGGGAATLAAHDTFVFAPHFGQLTVADFAPAADTMQFSKSVFANITALLTARHDEAHGNAAISDAAHDTITLQHVTTAQLLAHQSDFHFV